MPLANFEFTRISIEKKKRDVPRNIKVEHRSSLKKVEKSRKEGSVNVYFTFESNYLPDIANVSIEGVITLEDTSIDKIVENSKKGLKLKPDYMELVQNTIIRACLLLELMLAREMKLPLPISLPVVKLEK